MPTRRARHASVDVDQGFTLIEVIVALMLMSIVMMAGGGFMIRSVSSSSQLGGRQGAVTVANQVLEQVHAVNATFDSLVAATKTSPLVKGRGRTEVTKQWADAAKPAVGLDVTGTYTGAGSTTFDANTYTTTSTTPTVPLQQTIALGAQKYTVDVLIGTCVRVNADSECGLRGAIDPLDSVDELFRVVVRVTWTPGVGRTCSGSTCAYVVSTLIDPTPDPTFNVNRPPVAKDDSATTPVNKTVEIGVITNDSGNFGPAGAVTIISGPTVLSGPAALVGKTSGTISMISNVPSYTPAANFSGIVTFTYTVTDVTVRTSNIATVTVTVTPIAVNDTKSTTAGAAAVKTDVLTNDLGSGLSLVSVSTPSMGTAVMAGNSVSYTPPNNAVGVVTITYTAKDAAGQQYTGTLTITVTGPPAPIATSYTLCKPALSYQSNLMAMVSGTNLVASGLKLITTTTDLNGWGLSALNASGVVTITKVATGQGFASFSITDPLGQVSNTATVILKGSTPC